MRNAGKINLGNLLLSLSEAIDLASPAISRHQQRTAYIALETGKRAGLSDAMLSDLFIAALLHDSGALTVEEKRSIHRFEEIDVEAHCIRGEFLLRRIPFFERISSIVRNHHRPVTGWDSLTENPVALLSQILLAADYAERLINRRENIPDQRQSIVERIESLSGGVVHEKVIAWFRAVSESETFWHGMSSPELHSLIHNSGPLRNIMIGFDFLEPISRFFRDIIDFKSRFTATHTSGVAACAEILSRKYGFDEYGVRLMKIAGNFHDIGKLGIPNSILEKPGALEPDETLVMQRHAYYTHYVLESISSMGRIAEWAANHHERLDGSGYPFKLTGDRLSAGARIMAVADIFTALAEERPYKKAMQRESIAEYFGSPASRDYYDDRTIRLLIDNFSEIHDSVYAVQESVREFYDHRFSGIA